MQSFKYVITDPLGMHARPTGLFVKEASTYPCQVIIAKVDKSVDAKKIFAVMGLAVKCGDEVTVTTEGEGEDAACAALSTFMQTNF